MANAVQLQQRAGDGGVHGKLEPDARTEEEGREAGGIVRVKQTPTTPTSLLNLGPTTKKLVASSGRLRFWRLQRLGRSAYFVIGSFQTEVRMTTVSASRASLPRQSGATGLLPGISRMNSTQLLSTWPYRSPYCQISLGPESPNPLLRGEKLLLKESKIRQASTQHNTGLSSYSVYI